MFGGSGSRFQQKTVASGCWVECSWRSMGRYKGSFKGSFKGPSKGIYRDSIRA